MAPAQKPGRSRQDYQTPPILIQAIKKRLGINNFSIDLAASSDNTVCSRFIAEEMDSLSKERCWNYDGWCWCNPPYANIRPWVQKAYEESLEGAMVAMLVPASTGSNWWRDWVHEKAHVLLMNGRVTFVGETQCYPKDTVILLYTPFIRGGYSLWNWRKDDKGK